MLISDLRPLGLNLLSRLHLEEYILSYPPPSLLSSTIFLYGTHAPPPTPQTPSPTCSIVLGIGGKRHKLVHPSALMPPNPVPVLRRFSGGGTIVADDRTLFTSVICRGGDAVPSVKPFPRDIMKYTGSHIFAPVFDRLSKSSPRRKQASLVPSSASCGASSITGTVALDHPTFHLLENDYTFKFPSSKLLKIAGNAQSIKGESWLHHTSFLWDLPIGLEHLKIPENRPKYREGRDHKEFITNIGKYYPTQSSESFFAAIEDTFSEKIDAREMWDEVMTQVGGESGWNDFCRGGRNKARTHFVDEEGKRIED